MLLTRRPVKLGPSINCRTELHGDNKVPALDLQLHLLISSAELDELNGPGTADRTFDEGGGLKTPLDKHYAPRKFKGKFENSTADLWFGVNNLNFHFADCKLKSIVLDPKTGGMTAIKLTVGALINDRMLFVFTWMDHEGECELQFGKLTADDGQGELALKVPEDDKPEPPRGGNKRSKREKSMNGDNVVPLDQHRDEKTLEQTTDG